MFNGRDNVTAAHGGNANYGEQPGMTAFQKTRVAFDIVAAPIGRTWMAARTKAGADRCLPLRMASQYGWLILNKEPLEVVWNGGDSPNSIEIRYFGNHKMLAPISHFGDGIITWRIPYLFQTSPGYNLLVTGAMNYFKDGIAPLDALVETDWSAASFTMNWKITRPHTPIFFEKADPICMLIPQPRGLLERFAPQIKDLHQYQMLANEHEEWAESRAAFLKDLATKSLPRGSWQKHYFQGISLKGSRFQEHQTKLELKEFEDASEILLTNILSGNESSDVNLKPHADRKSVDTHHVIKEFWSGASPMIESFRINRTKEVWTLKIHSRDCYLSSRPEQFFERSILDNFYQQLRYYSIVNWGMVPLKLAEVKLYTPHHNRELYQGRGLACLRFMFIVDAPRHDERQMDFIIQEDVEQGDTLAHNDVQALRYSRIRAEANCLVVMNDHTAYGVREACSIDAFLVAPCAALCGFLIPVLIVFGSLSQPVAEAILQEHLEGFKPIKHDTGMSLKGYVTFKVAVSNGGEVIEVVPLHRQLYAGGILQDGVELIKLLVSHLRETRFPASENASTIFVPYILKGTEV